MPTTIQGPGGAGKPNMARNDVSMPPTPQVRVSVAFDRAAANAIFYAGSSTSPRPATRDPAYIELGNVEMGTTIQMINMSKTPDAQWGDKNNVVELKLTGRDVVNRQAAAYLTADQMEQLDLKPGDMLQLRAMDEEGNASTAVTAELEPNDWANGLVRENVNNTNVDTHGAQFSMLDGDDARKNIVAKAINDTRPPMMLDERLTLVADERFNSADVALAATLFNNWNVVKTTLGKDGCTREDLKVILDKADLPQPLRDAAKALYADKELFTRFETGYHNDPTKADGILGTPDLEVIRNFKRSVSLVADMAIEPRATVWVQNQRTGEAFQAQVGDDRKLKLNVGDVKDGDPLLIRPTDNEGQVGKMVELVFSSKFKDGKAPKLQGGLNVRLPGVI